MFSPFRPTPERIDRFLRESRDLPISYSPTGIVSPEVVRADLLEASVVIGRGRREFEQARAALLSWKQFDIGWTEIYPKTAPVEPGTTVAVLIRHLGFWSLNGCRILYRTGRPDGFRDGFAYGTLPNHAESGEELFEVSLDPRTDDVAYRIRAISWPQAMFSRAGHLVVRALQERFRQQSAAAMARATRG